jgi:hypothetical protein
MKYWLQMNQNNNDDRVGSVPANKTKRCLHAPAAKSDVIRSRRRRVIPEFSDEELEGDDDESQEEEEEDETDDEDEENSAEKEDG